jgi:hypothetical protein
MLGASHAHYQVCQLLTQLDAPVPLKPLLPKCARGTEVLNAIPATGQYLINTSKACKPQTQANGGNSKCLQVVLHADLLIPQRQPMAHSHATPNPYGPAGVAEIHADPNPTSTSGAKGMTNGSPDFEPRKVFAVSQLRTETHESA